MALLCAGCSEPRSPAPSKARPVPPAEPAVNVQAIDRAGLDALLAHHPKKVVLVDFWSLASEPTREQFAGIVALARKYADRGLVVISFNCDPAERTDEALEFLRAQDAPFQHLRSAYGSDEQTFDDFEVDGGTLPHFKVYDRRGKLRQVHHSDPASQEQVFLEALEASVKELLNEEP